VVSAAWDELLDALHSGGETVYSDPALESDPILCAESGRYLARLFASGALQSLELTDFEHPRLVRYYEPHLQWGMANPDCIYQYARISGQGTYRIHGTRGSARLLDVQTFNGHMSDLPDYRPLDTASDFETDSDGHIEIVLSRERSDRNWVPLREDTTWLFLRQYYYDWNTEIPADLVIEKDGAIYPPPPPTAADSDAQLRQLAGWLRNGPPALREFVQTFTRTPGDLIPFTPDPVGMEGLCYGRGHFACEADDAVILEVTPPDCLYWSFQLLNQNWESLDWHVRQTSLNGHQATLDDDGVFRAVISHHDPGVPNWLDPAGHTHGLIGGRWLRATSNPSATLQTVPFEDLRKHLPPHTPQITQPQRQEQLRQRMLGVARRHRA
jgi:hypothetical protein